MTTLLMLGLLILSFALFAALVLFSENVISPPRTHEGTE